MQAVKQLLDEAVQRAKETGRLRRWSSNSISSKDPDEFLRLVQMSLPESARKMWPSTDLIRSEVDAESGRMAERMQGLISDVLQSECSDYTAGNESSRLGKQQQQQQQGAQGTHAAMKGGRLQAVLSIIEGLEKVGEIVLAGGDSWCKWYRPWMECTVRTWA